MIAVAVFRDPLNKKRRYTMTASYNTEDFLTRNPVTFDPDTDILDAIHVLLQRKVSGGTVLNEHNEVVGIISELDCLRAMIHMAYYREGGGTVKEFMTTATIDHIDSHLSLVDAAQRLLDTRHRRMPMIINGRFAGQISARSILQAFKDSIMAHDKSEDEIAI
jgi:CBS domain-containing protein